MENNNPVVLQNNTIVTVNNNSAFDYQALIVKMSEEDKKKCLSLTDNVKISDLASVQSYGAELNKVIAQNGDTLLSSVNSTNSDEIVNLTTSLLSEFDMIDLKEINGDESVVKKLLKSIPVVKKMFVSVKKVKNKFNTVSKNINEISNKISQTKTNASKDNATLEGIKSSNMDYIEKIRELIIGLKLREQEVMRQLEEMAEQNVDAFQIQNMQVFLNSIQKKIADMQVTEYMLTQNIFQICATQKNNIDIINNADNIITNVIPIWKNQLSLSLMMNNQKASVQAHTMLKDATQTMLINNAELLKSNSIAVAKENDRPMIEIETLNKTTQYLRETITECRKIREQGEQNRLAIETTIRDAAGQLRIAAQGGIH